MTKYQIALHLLMFMFLFPFHFNTIEEKEMAKKKKAAAKKKAVPKKKLSRAKGLAKSAAKVAKKKPTKKDETIGKEFRTSYGPIFGARVKVIRNSGSTIDVELLEDHGVFNKGGTMTMPRYELRASDWDGFSQLDEGRKAANESPTTLRIGAHELGGGDDEEDEDEGDEYDRDLAQE